MKYGIIISVERYMNKENFPIVKYANTDGNAIKKMFLDKLKILEKNICCYENENFTKERFENDIAYYLRSLEPGSELFFYYAGHGFYSDGTNYLTGYDTSILDLHQTSISFDNFMSDYIKSSNLNKCFFFIDACSELKDTNSRNIDYRGLKFSSSMINSSNSAFSYAIFISCSPKEKSYASDKLRHGIWTWYLLKAFEGYSEALVDNKYLTVSSLEKYLSDSVKKYSESDKIVHVQTPYTIIASNHDEVIIDCSEITDLASLEQMSNTENFSFEKECNSVKFLLFNSCSLACYERGIMVDNPVNCFEVENFGHVIEVCKQVINMGYLLPYNWEASISQLRFYCEMLDTDNIITISYEQQKSIIDDVYEIIDNIPDGW